MCRFAKLLAQVDATRWTPADPQAAILVPATFYVNYPFRSVDRSRLFKAMVEAYTLARMAGFDVLFVPEPALPPNGVRLLLVPFADLLSPTWHDLQSWVEAGGVLWAGFGGAVPNLEELFGVRVGKRRGVLSLTQKERTKLRLMRPFGDLRMEEQVVVPAADVPHLPIASTTARILAVDEDDRPGLTVHAAGRGRAFFCSRSLEWLLALAAEVHRWSAAHRLYRAL